MGSSGKSNAVIIAIIIMKVHVCAILTFDSYLSSSRRLQTVNLVITD
jgi:hypothetical protein